MQISITVNKNLEHRFDVKEKILEKETGYCKLEIYQSEVFGKIFLIDGKHAYLENEMPMLDEMAAHVPACSHFSASRALVLGGINTGIAGELLRHPKMVVDMVDPDGTLLQETRKYFPYQEKTWTNERFCFAPSNGLSWITDFNDAMYDIIIVNGNDIVSGLDCDVIATLDRILKEDGICVIRCGHVIYHHESVKTILSDFGEKFQVAMPYMPFHTSVPYGFVYASKKFHPTADLYLQKADMLDDLSYYTAEFHKAAFSLPRFLESAFKGVAKN